MEGIIFILSLLLVVGVVEGVGDVNHDRPYSDLPGMPISLSVNQNQTACAGIQLHS